MLYLISSFKNTSKINLELNGIRIKYVSSFPYLGVIIDNELQLSAYTDCVLSLSQIYWIFYNLGNKLPKRVLKNIYFAFVHPYILYGIEIYANTSRTHIDKLVKLNNTLLSSLKSEH